MLIHIFIIHDAFLKVFQIYLECIYSYVSVFSSLIFFFGRNWVLVLLFQSPLPTVFKQSMLSVHKNRWPGLFLQTSTSAGLPHKKSELSEILRNKDEDNHHVKCKGCLSIFWSGRPKRAVRLFTWKRILQPSATHLRNWDCWKHETSLRFT